MPDEDGYSLMRSVRALESDVTSTRARYRADCARAIGSVDRALASGFQVHLAETRRGRGARLNGRDAGPSLRLSRSARLNCRDRHASGLPARPAPGRLARPDRQLHSASRQSFESRRAASDTARSIAGGYYQR